MKQCFSPSHSLLNEFEQRIMQESSDSNPENNTSTFERVLHVFFASVLRYQVDRTDAGVVLSLSFRPINEWMKEENKVLLNVISLFLSNKFPLFFFTPSSLKEEITDRNCSLNFSGNIFSTVILRFRSSWDSDYCLRRPCSRDKEEDVICHDSSSLESEDMQIDLILRRVCIKGQRRSWLKSIPFYPWKYRQLIMFSIPSCFRWIKLS